MARIWHAYGTASAVALFGDSSRERNHSLNFGLTGAIPVLRLYARVIAIAQAATVGEVPEIGPLEAATNLSAKTAAESRTQRTAWLGASKPIRHKPVEAHMLFGSFADETTVNFCRDTHHKFA
jgi:hypothetical protein